MATVEGYGSRVWVQWDNGQRLMIRNEHAGIGNAGRSDESSLAEREELDGEQSRDGQLEQGQPQRERAIRGRGRNYPETFTKL